MTSTPSPDPHRFQPLDPTAFVEARVALSSRPPTEKQLKGWLKKYLSETEVSSALDGLEARGRLKKEEAKLVLDERTRSDVRAKLGKDVSQPFDTLAGRRFGLMALGLDPDDGDARKRIGRADGLQTLIIAVGYGIPKQVERTRTEVRNELLWRVLRAYLGEVLGAQSLPKLEEPGRLERTLICGLAGRPARTNNDAWAALAAMVVDSERSDPESLRAALLVRGLRRSMGAPKPPLDEPPADAFAERVLSVARALLDAGASSFGDNVPIADIYDAYGRDHADAGSLASFKSRLVASAEKRALLLTRLDMPELMSAEQRERSATRYGYDDRHMVRARMGNSHEPS